MRKRERDRERENKPIGASCRRRKMGETDGLRKWGEEQVIKHHKYALKQCVNKGGEKRRRANLKAV